jgi:hypothetical protein
MSDCGVGDRFNFLNQSADALHVFPKVFAVHDAPYQTIFIQLPTHTIKKME